MHWTPWPCEINGFAANPPLVLLHGYLGAGSDWRPLVKRLEQRWLCITPDLPGHGYNQPPEPERPLSLRRWAGELGRTLRGLQIPAAHVLGYSLGGRLALHLAATRPQLVRSLVLESASPGLEGRQQRAQRRVLDDQRAQQLHRVGMAAFLQDWYSQPLFASLHAHPEAQPSLLAGRAANNPGWMARVVADLSPGRQPSLWGRLAEMQMPVLLLAGELDATYAAYAHRAAGLLPSARMALAPGAGHNLHLETPAWHFQQVFNFLAAVETQAAAQPLIEQDRV